MRMHIPHRQTGATLVVALVMLLVVTMIGVTSMRSATLEERMSGNFRDYQLAFEAAELALREAERTVANLPPFNPGSFSSTCAGGMCFTGDYDPNDPNSACRFDGDEDIVWSDTSTDYNVWASDNTPKKYMEATKLADNVSQEPRYIIEFRCHSPTAPNPSTVAYVDSGWKAEWGETYRITAIGYGGSVNARVMLQSTYVKGM